MTKPPKNPAAPPANNWRNRVTGYGEEDPSSLLANPKNWRIHPESQQAALGAVLDQVGWVGVGAIVNKRTGFVVDGHARVALAIARNEPSIPVAYVDLSEAEENLILASYDSISAAAVTDADKLTELLGGIEIANPALDALFGDLMDAGRQISLEDVGGDGAADSSGEGGSDGRLPADRAAIKAVLHAEEVTTFETALRATGEINRGRALMAVCQYYLDNAKG